MKPSFRYELLTLTLLSCLLFVISSPLHNEPTVDDKTEYLTSRSDIDAALSKIIKPDEQIALLTDFDGTLAVINPDPYKTAIKPESKAALDTLATRDNVFMAVISGRPMFNVRSKIGIDNITAAGNHGMEAVFSNQTQFHYPITAEMFLNCTEIKTQLLKDFNMDKRGGWIEDKNISLVFHYHHVPTEDRANVVNDVTEIIKNHGYKAIPAHEAIEIKPPVNWSKGHVALLILDEYFGRDWPSKNIRVIYLGDDTSDEDAMRLLKGKGTTFRVTANPDLESNANYKLQSVDTVSYLLEWLVANTQ